MPRPFLFGYEALARLSPWFLIGFTLRLLLRLHSGEADFWANGYSDYYTMAESVVSGHGFCLATACAWWPPIYPAFLALTAIAGKHWLPIILLQSLIGAGTIFCAYKIALELGGRRAGLLAAAVTAVYPYYVIHDTALQETGLVTFLTALTVCLLLRANRAGTTAACIAAGVAIAALPLTRAALLPTAFAALAWTFWRIPLKAPWTLAAFTLVVSPWLIRTWLVTGSPVFSLQTGRALWIGNNPDTFSRYPKQSIDRSHEAAAAAMGPADRAELERAEVRGERAESNWYAHRAWTFILAHPGTTLVNALRKILAGFSWSFNPERSPAIQTVYASSYVPVAALGLVGMVRLRRRMPERVLIGLLFVCFTAVTAVFWAHSSHRSYLDVYLIVLAAVAAFQPSAESPMASAGAAEEAPPLSAVNN